MTIMYEVRQKISNHPVLTDLERDVVITRIADNADGKQEDLNIAIYENYINLKNTKVNGQYKRRY